MTAQQVLGSILVAIITALATAYFNNRYEQGRQDRAWKREKEERRTQYKRLRLEERAKPIEEWVRSAVGVAWTMYRNLRLAVCTEADLAKFRDFHQNQEEQLQLLTRELDAMGGVLLTLGDGELMNLLWDLDDVWHRLLATAHLLCARDKSPAYYQEKRGELGTHCGILDDKTRLLILKIDSILEAAGS